MELWILDYKGEEKDDEKAQILQLKFMSDLFYEQDSFGKNMSCSQRSPIEQVSREASYFQTKNLAATSMDSHQMLAAQSLLSPIHLSQPEAGKSKGPEQSDSAHAATAQQKAQPDLETSAD